MTFRGYVALNGVEIANSSRVAAHTGVEIPTSDVGLIGNAVDCSILPVDGHPLLGTIPASMVPIAPGSLLGTVPDGARLFSPGLALVGDCWDDRNLCFGCRDFIEYDDTWPGLMEFLGDRIYRPELAPWYTSQIPESAEFGGVMLLDIKGLEVSTVQMDVTELAGDGGVPGPFRDTSRKVTFDALLVACTTAGLDYGLQWLTCQLRAVNTTTGYGTLRYLASHPSNSAVDPDSLVRDAYGVVLTSAPTIQAAMNTSRKENSQATIYRVNWELTVTHPRVYLPPVSFSVDWDTVTVNPIQWVHATDCGTIRLGCDPDPKLFAEGCEPIQIDAVNTPPPTCGGCLPVCSVAEHVWAVPSFDYAMRCRETAVTLVITNTGDSALNLQGYFRRCNVDDECDKGDIWPVQVTGLPSTAVLTLDGISGRASVFYYQRTRRPIGIVGTPTGAPWLPPVMDRSLCWEFVVLSSGAAEFTVTMTLADREA